MKIALAGNPNSGKTTMYNTLTGKSETVGNWAGVTVEIKEHVLKRVFDPSGELVAVDLPGAYSMSPFTSEESVTRHYIEGEAPDVLINIVDADNLSRSLFFTTQLLELGIPTVIALNKSDTLEKKGTVIDADALSKMLGCPVLQTVATESAGLAKLVETARGLIGQTQKAPFRQELSSLSNAKAAEAADRARFAFVNDVVKAVEKRTLLTRNRGIGDKIDEILVNRFFGIPLFAVTMWLVFQISQAWVGPLVADGLVAFLEGIQEKLATLLQDASPLLTALLVDGVFGGVIAVLGFLPLVMVMYFLIALLEDCGYMSRVAVVLDPIFKKVGLSGKSVIPFVIAVGCAVPGVMASRTIRDENERRATAMLAPFMPCGAKIPVISLFAGAFFDNAGWISTLMYFSGIVLIFLGALLVNRISGNYAKRSFFIIELPAYKFPSIPHAAQSMLSRGWAYIVKASTVILLCNTVVQLMQSFNWSFTPAQSADSSILASIAAPFAYLLVPVVGVLSWQLAAAVITGFIAKENVVGTLAVCFVGLENLIDADALELMEGAGAEAAGIMAISKAAALAYLMFNLYSPPCFAAIGAMNAEMKSAKWLLAGIGLQLAVGYTVSYIVYTVGTLITAPASLDLPAAVCGLAAILATALVILAVIRSGDRRRQAVKNAK